MGFKVLSAVLGVGVLLTACGERQEERAEERFSGSVHPELQAHTAEFRQEVIKVTDGVFVAVGFGLANSILIEGDDGVIIVDTMESRSEAEAVKAAFAEITDKPIRGVILTHNHTDHIYGGSVFTGNDPSVEVWAHASTEYYIDRIVSMISSAISLRSMRMFGQFLTDAEVENAGIGPKLAFKTEEMALARPTHTFEESTDIEIAGVKLTLVHAPGETPDQLFVWLPEKRVLLPGDNFYRAFPNLYTIRGTAYRDVLDWVEALDKMRSHRPTYLVPSHTRPLEGEDYIYEHLTAYRDAIQFVHDQTIRTMNKGMTPDQAVGFVKLPPHLAENEFLRPFYGTVERCCDLGAYGSGHAGDTVCRGSVQRAFT
jgi:alkyl sulfatase BDS1-like metallo-beta-lactamase superfamily hydrolase